MENIISALQQFTEKLAANPAIKVIAQRLPYIADSLKLQNDTPRLLRIKKLFEQEQGFTVPADGVSMLALPQVSDIAWAPVAPVEDYVQGEINLMNPSLALLYYQLSVANPESGERELQPLYYFDAGSTLSGYDPATVYCYDEATQQYGGLAVVLDKNQLVLPLNLSWGEYVALALAWHGAQGWPLLYLELEEFLELDLYLRRSVYAFPRALPALFPEADWSILATKSDYFATEPAA